MGTKYIQYLYIEWKKGREFMPSFFVLMQTLCLYFYKLCLGKWPSFTVQTLNKDIVIHGYPTL